MSKHPFAEDISAQVQLLAEAYSAGSSILEIREAMELSERQFAQLFLRAQQDGLVAFDPNHVRGARFGSTLKKELTALLGIGKGEDPILLLKKTSDGVLVSPRSTSPETLEGARHV